MSSSSFYHELTAKSAYPSVCDRCNSFDLHFVPNISHTLHQRDVGGHHVKKTRKFMENLLSMNRRVT